MEVNTKHTKVNDTLNETFQEFDLNMLPDDQDESDLLNYEDENVDKEVRIILLKGRAIFKRGEN